MVTQIFTIKTIGPHNRVAWRNSPSTLCVNPGGNILENLGANHNVFHTFTFSDDVNAGDRITVSLRELIFANQKTITLLLLGRQLGSSSGTTQCATVSHVLTADDLTLVGMPNGPPTYLEELHKLDRTTSSHYIPR